MLIVYSWEKTRNYQALVQASLRQTGSTKSLGVRKKLVRGRKNNVDDKSVKGKKMMSQCGKAL